MSAESLDLLVIGAGTGANGVSRGCARAGWKVAVVDSLPYGGTCALRGCDPKKMLVGVTEALDWTHRMGGNGVHVDGVELDWSEMMTFKRTFTNAMPGRIERGFEKLWIEALHGTATFISRDAVRVGDRVFQPRFVHVAAGSRPATLGIPGEDLVSTSTDFLDLPELPPRIAFVGGGFISFEFAHVARRAGAAQVTILHRGARPLVRFDPDLVDLQVERTRELGVDVRLESRVVGIEEGDGSFALSVETERGLETIMCDLVVHGAGRVPNVDALDLEAGGVDVTAAGIVVNASMRSVSNPKVFAAGDCAASGAPNLTPVSANEGRIALKNLLAGGDARTVHYPPIPTAVFTLPPLAAVGLLESEARDQGLDVEVQYRRTDGWYSSLRVGETYSAHKVLVERGSGRIVGAHVLGPGAEEQINLFAIAMGANMTANELKGVVFAYPSYASDLASMV